MTKDPFACKIGGACSTLPSVGTMCWPCQMRWHRATAQKIEDAILAGKRPDTEPEAEHPFARIETPPITFTTRTVREDVLVTCIPLDGPAVDLHADGTERCAACGQQLNRKGDV